MFKCDAWYIRRNVVDKNLGTTLEPYGALLEPDNIINTMLTSKKNWDVINHFINDIMSQKEQEERQRQSADQE